MYHALLLFLELVLYTFIDAAIWNTIIGKCTGSILVVKEYLIIELTGLLTSESVANQIKEYNTTNEVSPDIYGLVMYHKEATDKFAIAIEINSIACHYVVIMKHKFFGFIIISYITRLFN